MDIPTLRSNKNIQLSIIQNLVTPKNEGITIHPSWSPQKKNIKNLLQQHGLPSLLPTFNGWDEFPSFNRKCSMIKPYP
jgi:hypothetical protein